MRTEKAMSDTAAALQTDFEKAMSALRAQQDKREKRRKTKKVLGTTAFGTKLPYPHATMDDYEWNAGHDSSERRDSWANMRRYLHDIKWKNPQDMNDAVMLFLRREKGAEFDWEEKAFRSLANSLWTDYGEAEAKQRKTP